MLMSAVLGAGFLPQPGRRRETSSRIDRIRTVGDIFLRILETSKYAAAFAPSIITQPVGD
jgi:hypothetical protein